MEPERKKHPGGPREKPKKAFSYEEIAAFMGAINRRSSTGKRTYALAMFLFATGARITETLNMNREDLDLLHGQAWLRVAKMDKPRQVTISLLDDVREAMEDWYTVREAWNPKSDLVFVSRPGNNPRVSKDNELMDYVSVLRAFATVSKRAGLVCSISPHMLRHSHATLALKNGGNISGLAKQLGNEQETLLKYYAHIISDEQRQAAEAFDKGWNRA